MAQFNPADKATVDIPLLIRIMEFSREDAKTDMDLHKVAENIIALSETGRTLTMSDYDAIVKDSDGEDNPPMAARMQKLAGLNTMNKNF
jgi:hypothetical protein